MSHIVTPSYKSGFASPSRGEMEYPSLWRGCVGAWCPSLGETGLVLRDHSGYGNHGTLTNMDPATDWVASNGKMALDFDGSNDFVSAMPGSQLSNVSGSISFWVKPTNSWNSGVREFWFGTDLAGYGGIEFQNWFSNTLYVGWQDYSPSADYRIVVTRSSTNWTQNIWGTYVLTWGFGNSFLYFNGVTIGSHASTTVNIDNSSFPNLRIAAVVFDSTRGSGQLDDFRVYNRVLTPSEIKLLATRRGIAYETKRIMAGRQGAAAVTRFRNSNSGTRRGSRQTA